MRGCVKIEKICKTFLMRCMCVLIMIALPTQFLCHAASGISTTTSIVSGAIYYIRNANSGHYLDAENSGNFNVIQYAYHGGLNQAWKITKNADGYYTLENQSSYYKTQGRKMLSVSETTTNADLYYTNSSLTTQKWRITANSDGTVYFTNGWINQVLETQNASMASPYNVGRYANNGSRCQKWYLERVPTVKTSLATVQSQLPTNKFWNHSPSSANNAASVTTAGCTHHNSGCNYYGTCGCNSYNSAIQCMGYAMYVANKFYQSNVRNWISVQPTSNNPAVNILSLVKPGDYIRYNTHSILVTGISSDLGTIYFTDANSDNKCIIKWNRSISKSSLASSLVAVYKAPYLLLT